MATFTIVYFYCLGVVLGLMSINNARELHGNKQLNANPKLPLVLTTWGYRDAVKAGYDALMKTYSAVDAVETTGHSCEMSQCRHTVGFGGSPDENGETTLDAMIMDGKTYNVGGVGGLRRIKQAISVARKVLDTTNHSLLVGDAATQFAIEMGFSEENLTTPYSELLWQTWRNQSCQPNFRKNVTPDPRKSCGPYHSGSEGSRRLNKRDYIIDAENHDTIGIIAMDSVGNIASGASTNGLIYKVPGRVGDTAIAGAGSYAENGVGAAACTGNGDIMMRFLPSHTAVTLMRSGLSVQEATVVAIGMIAKQYPDFKGAVVAADAAGNIGATCHLWTNFQITYMWPGLTDVQVANVTCLVK